MKNYVEIFQYINLWLENKCGQLICMYIDLGIYNHSLRRASFSDRQVLSDMYLGVDACKICSPLGANTAGSTLIFRCARRAKFVSLGPLAIGWVQNLHVRLDIGFLFPIDCSCNNSHDDVCARKPTRRANRSVHKSAITASVHTHTHARVYYTHADA